MYILGLDISTSKIGYSVIDYNSNLIDCQVIKLNSKDSLERRAELFQLEMSLLWRKYEGIEHIFVEQPFMAFSGGRTTAATMAKLQRFNGMCCYGVYNVFGSTPVHVSANQARSSVGIKRKRGEDIKKKVVEWVQANYPKDFIVEYTRYGNPKPGTDDKADAVIVALSGKKILDK